MYGVVLLMAVTAGGESADLGRRSKGCCGYVASCCGYSCRGSSCCGYSCGGSSCRGYSCGGYVAAPTCGGYAPTCGGYSPAPTCGGYAPAPTCGGYVPAPTCGGGVPHMGHGKRVAAASPNAATVVVTLPADAKLTIDGDATTSTSSERTFETPDLVAGKTYAYTLEATFQQDGKAVVVSKKVKIEAGKTATVDLNPTPVTGVARN